MHAYLIMVHENIEQLKILLKVLDDERNDIYVHIDIKAGIVDWETLRKNVTSSKLHFVERIDVVWGDYSQIKCEILLIKAAVKNKSYQYIHLLSGSDMPIKSQNYIHDFFKKNAGKEFVHFETDDVKDANRDKAALYYPLQRFVGESKGLLYYLQRVLVKFQKFLGMDRIRNCTCRFAKGANWFSITGDFASYLVSQEEWISKKFKNTLCCDELFLQTVLINSVYKDNLYYMKYDNNYEGNMRYIVWENSGKESHPRIFDNRDYDVLKKSEMLFARKFSSSVEKSLILNLVDRNE